MVVTYRSPKVFLDLDLHPLQLVHKESGWGLRFNRLFKYLSQKWIMGHLVNSTAAYI